MSFNGRQVAYKMWISNLLNGKFFNSAAQYEPNILEVDDLKISRVNLLGTIVDKFSKKDNRYVSVTLDDSSAAIDLKCWGEDTQDLENIEVGDFILVIGKVKRYNDLLYLAPEIVRRVDNPLWLKLRKLELLNLYGDPKKIEIKQFNDALTEVHEENLADAEDNLELRGKILTLVEKMDRGDGVDLANIEKELKVSLESIKEVLLELLMDGEVFEVQPRMYRVMP